MHVGEFPGLWHLASEIIHELKSGKSVVVQFPGRVEQGRWAKRILAACDSLLRLERDQVLFEPIEIGSGKTRPADVLVEFGVSGDLGLSSFLTEFGREPLAITLPRSWKELPEWSQFLVDITRRQRTISGGDEARFLVFFSLGLELPEGVSRASLATFQLWNPVEWEEMRIAARARLGSSNSDVELSWMVSTYVGAANLDPELLIELCERQPRTLSDVLSLITSKVSQVIDDGEIDGFDFGLEGGTAWRLPADAARQWQANGLFGRTPDRGIRQDLRAIPEVRRDRQLRYRIWQEQATGLLPLTVELSVTANRLLDNWLPAGWRTDLAADAEVDEAGTYFLEPAQILRFLRSTPKIRLSDIPFQLLKQLRKVRNRLAHMEAIELAALQTMRDVYLRTKRLSAKTLT